MVLVAKSMLWDVENHLGQFPEASDRHEGQELDCEAVGGQGGLQEAKFYLGESFGTIFRSI